MKLVKKFVMATLLFLTCLPQTHALEPEEVESSQTEQESPSLDFLEFLGEWETEDGEWIAPDDLENMPLNENEDDDTNDK
ncbi:MAG: hypothetical protein ACI8PD_001409 [Nitrospinales bacterium]|jgi:hypothetical protein